MQNENTGKGVCSEEMQRPPRDPNLARLKLVRVDPEFIIAIINRPFVRYDTLRLPLMDALPDDVQCLAVHNDFLRRSLTLVLQHPSFEPVPDGLEPPEVKTGWHIVDVVKVEPSPSNLVSWRLAAQAAEHMALALCGMIEKLPAGEQQTRCSGHAAALREHLQKHSHSMLPPVAPHAEIAAPVEEALRKDQSNGSQPVQQPVQD